MNQVVRWNAGCITVRPGTVADDIAAQIIARQVADCYPPDMVGLYGQFATLCSQTIDSDGLPFKPEHVRNMDAGQKRLAYEAFLTIAQRIRDRWIAALNLTDEVVDLTVGPAALADNADPKA